MMMTIPSTTRINRTPITMNRYGTEIDVEPDVSVLLKEDEE